MESNNNIPPDNGGQPDTFSVGQGVAQGAGVPSNVTEGNKVDTISDRLSQKEAGGGAENTSVAEAHTALPFDIASLNREQLQALKSMLAATPDGGSRKKLKPRIRLRRIDDNIVTDFKRAKLGLVDDHELGRKVERHLIEVKYLGSENYVTVLYKNFIESEQVACEVLSERHETNEVVEGETISRETGALVDMVRRDVLYWFTVQLPEGSSPATVEIPARVANG